MRVPDGPTIRRALQASYDTTTIARGQVYARQKRVTDCAITPEPDTGLVVTAAVRGSAAKPYRAAVSVLEEDGEWTVEGDCTCPVAMDCKHCAAALLHAADRLTSQPADTFSFYDQLLPATTPRVAAPAPVPVDPLVKAWLDQIAARVETNHPDPVPEETETQPERLLYLLRPQNGRVRVELNQARVLKKGGFGQPRNYQFSNLIYQPNARFVTAEDVQLARRILLTQPHFSTYEAFLEGAGGAELLPELLATGRCHWRGCGRQHPTLKLGATRHATADWEVDQKGCQKPVFKTEKPVTAILPVEPLWYVDETTQECGPLETNLPPAVATAWLAAPVIRPEVAEAVALELADHQKEVPLPQPRNVAIDEIARVRPTARLTLYSARLRSNLYGYGWRKEEPFEERHFARLEFDYEGIRIAPHAPGAVVERFTDGHLRRMRRDTLFERKANNRLMADGLMPADTLLFHLNLGPHTNALTCEDETNWLEFVHRAVPELREQGWQIHLDASFQLRIVEPDEWYNDAEAEAGGNDWFGVELGIVVDGKKVNLLPILLKLFRENPRTLKVDELAQRPDDAVLPVPLPDGGKVMLTTARARQMLGALLELMNPDALNKNGQLRLPRLRAIEFADDSNWRWLGAAELRDFAQRLRGFSGIQAVPPPATLSATLRPYQLDGLSWLQFLREYDLAGILADDMGLGKTVQALAHLVVEKQSGRMDRPSLIIAPTSLMTNWRQEAERFAPDLRVLVLHGLERKKDFDRIADHDLIVTSYPLLPRDHGVLKDHEFHYVILDEAQYIKNPKTKFAQAACSLKARHRLCLTGTPMENHLGELWSLFRFLLPGFLGDEIRFNAAFRRPIEKSNDDERRRLLAKRVAPFLLRRRKEQVVKELPPKTEIVQNVELSGAQRDLYESVRLAMHQRVKDEVGKKGLSRSHIIILDALLKLRQICCHPQLLSLPSAKKVKDSAKLELLLDLVPEMIAEGRRILLFSQFTSMLALIETELAKQKIPYVLLTGDTNDRATPVRRFQALEVPLFLISLKAGGTGLNLTAADTVIHYDPWWNPAVENQATDRAHRIGQEKNVFVYKLMTVGTVEEKIGAMQIRKRELVEGLLNEEHREQLKLSAEDLDVLFAPIG